MSTQPTSPLDLTPAESRRADKLVAQGFAVVQVSYDRKTGARALYAGMNPARPGVVLNLPLRAWTK